MCAVGPRPARRRLRGRAAGGQTSGTWTAPELELGGTAAWGRGRGHRDVTGPYCGRTAGGQLPAESPFLTVSRPGVPSALFVRQQPEFAGLTACARIEGLVHALGEAGAAVVNDAMPDGFGPGCAGAL